MKNFIVLTIALFTLQIHANPNNLPKVFEFGGLEFKNPNLECKKNGVVTINKKNSNVEKTFKQWIDGNNMYSLNGNDSCLLTADGKKHLEINSDSNSINMAYGNCQLIENTAGFKELSLSEAEKETFDKACFENTNNVFETKYNLDLDRKPINQIKYVLGSKVEETQYDSSYSWGVSSKKWYRKNGLLLKEKIWEKDGLLASALISYKKDGSPFKKRMYKDGKVFETLISKNNVWKLQSFQNKDSGNKHFVTYYDNGNKGIETISDKDGNKISTIFHNKEDGSPFKKTMYKDGQVFETFISKNNAWRLQNFQDKDSGNKHLISYHDNGNKSMEIISDKDGNKISTKFYNENGELFKTMKYKDGELVKPTPWYKNLW